MIDSIAHISDIHIRLFKRHDEYRSVFSKLYKDLTLWASQYKTGLIVLSGDIVHSKTDMSPEMIAVTSEFLQTISAIAKTIIIAGNHDCNLSNNTRMDALTPIIDNINSENLLYFKNSGVYQVDDVGFGVYSILGDPANWPSVNDVKGTYKIALYHGPVISAKTDVGYTINSHAINLNKFDGYDIVMLGDIHKHQTLQALDSFNNKPIVVYAGSLIQQNYGENLHPHGWLEWDLKSKTFIHREAINDYGYIKLEISDAANFALPSLPKNVRLRLETDNIDAAGIKKIISMIRKKCNLLEYTVSKLTSKQISNTTCASQQDIKNVINQNKLIEDYIKEYYPELDKDLIAEIIKINTKLNANILDDDLPKNILWKPLILKFDNLFSYGKGNVIDFSNMTGLYGVFSANATGKTSAFDALCFALYDKTPRAFKGTSIINNRQDECSCELEFDVAGEIFKITRSGSRKKNKDVKIDVVFSKKHGDSWINLTGEDRRDTNSIIRSYVGDYEDFVLTTLSVQNENALFIDKGQTERKDLLSQFMGLTIFDRLYQAATDDSKELYSSIKQYTDVDFSLKLVETTTEIRQLEEKHDEASTDLAEYNHKLSVLDNSIQSLLEDKIPNVTLIDPAPIINKKAYIQENIISQTVKLNSEINELDRIDILLNEMNVSASLYSSDIDSNYKIYLDNKNTLDQYKIELNILKNDLSHNNIHLNKLKLHKYDPNCKFCMDNIFVKEAATIQFTCDEIQYKISKLESAIKSLNLDSSVESEFKKKELLQKLIHKTIDSKNKIILSIDNIKLGLDKHNLMIDECDRILSEYESNKLSIEINTSIDNNLKLYNIERDELTRKIRSVESLLNKLHGNISVKISEKDIMLEKIAKLKSLEKMYEAYEYYLNIISRDGIPYKLIHGVLPSIQDSINNTLQQMVDFTINLEMDGKNVNGKIIYDDNRSWPLELASGMEKFISGLAIRVALTSVSNLPKTNFLIIDEGLGVLDSDSLSSIFMMFGLLKTKFDFIILISHLDVVRDIADTVIEIKRENDYSYINVT